MMVAMTLVVVDLGDLRHCFVLSACFPLLARPRGRDGQGRERSLFLGWVRCFEASRLMKMKEAEGQSLFVWSGYFCCPATRSNTQAPATGAVMDGLTD